MAKITRYDGNLKAFASNAQGTERTVFGEETQSDVLTDQITTEFLRGWGIVGPSDNPTREDFNALGYALSQLLAYIHQAGIPEWNDEQEYFDGAITNKDGIIYRSVSSSNIGNDPAVDDGSNWRSIEASQVSYDNSTSGLAAEDLQEAIDELDDEKADSSILGTASEADVTTTQNSETEDKVIKVGDYGNGLCLPRITEGDLDNRTVPGEVFIASASVSNTPAEFGFEAVLVEVIAGSVETTSGPHTANRIVQRATIYTGGLTGSWATRSHNGTSWSSWFYGYVQETVELGGDFDSGEEVVCSKVGNVVTITGVGASLSHSSTGTALSASGIIPSAYRPTADVTNMYSMDSSRMARIQISAAGTLQLAYRDYSGTIASDTDSILCPSITYVIT